MNKLKEHLTYFLDSCDSLISCLTEPDPKSIPDKIQRQITHKRNQILLLVQIILIFFFLIDIFIKNTHIGVTIVRILTALTISTSLGFCAKYHPRIFSILYNLICLAHGPSNMSRGDEGLYEAWFASLYLPWFVYLFTGSLSHTLVQTTFQMLLNHTIYREKMKESIVFMSPADFERILIGSTNSAFAFQTVLFLSYRFLMHYIYKTVANAEKKKDEAENQKNFLLGFSHELRNLINSLTGNVKLASLEALNSKTKELLLNAEVCGELLLHLVNNILDTGKVEIGELEINPVSTKIHDTLERIWGVCSELIKTKNLRGKLTIPKDLPRNIMIDHYRLTQIFLNLVGNAVKFTDTGSIEINVNWISDIDTIKEESFEPYPFNTSDDYDEGLFEKSKTLTVLDNNTLNLSLLSRKIDYNLLKQSTEAGKGILKITITDTGCGMCAEEIDKLFQRFSQVTSDASKRKLGTGLGLFISKQICQRMKGHIRVFSKKGNGTSFVFCIPIRVVQEESSYILDSESIKQLVISQKLKVMVVDDVVFNHTVLGEFFNKLGIEVVDIAKNGMEAYEKYYWRAKRGNQPHIVTMDLEMPIMDGKEAARRIRKFEKEKGLKPCCLIIVSGNCTESEIAECMSGNGEINANAFIKKPASIEELLRVTTEHFVCLRAQ